MFTPSCTKYIIKDLQWLWKDSSSWCWKGLWRMKIQFVSNLFRFGVFSDSRVGRDRNTFTILTLRRWHVTNQSRWWRRRRRSLLETRTPPDHDVIYLKSFKYFITSIFARSNVFLLHSFVLSWSERETWITLQEITIDYSCFISQFFCHHKISFYISFI